MGQVRIPAQGGGVGLGIAETTVRQPLGATAQTAANAQQAVVAQADAPADDMKAHETGAAGGAVEGGFCADAGATADRRDGCAARPGPDATAPADRRIGPDHPHSAGGP